MKRTIACLGDSCVDRYEQLGKLFPGGNPVNYAVYTRRLGGSASFVGAVGSDPEGELLLQALRDRDVDVSHVQVLPGKTPVSHVEMQNGNRVFTAYDPGVMTDFSLREEDYAFLAAHDIVVTAPWGCAEAALPRLRALGLTVAYDCADLPFDPAPQLALPHTDIAFFSDDAADIRGVKRTIRTLRRLGPRIVVAMRGAKGSLAYDGRRYYTQEAISCPVVDTLGAGDSYIAGFLYAHLQGLPMQECMRIGAENSAVTIGYTGAW